MALGQKEIRLSIKANTAKFEESLKKLPNISDKEAKKMASKMAKQFDKAEQSAKKNAKKTEKHYKKAFDKMGISAQKLKSLIGPALFAAAAVGIFKLANAASEYTDKIMLMEAQTGISNETLIGMEFAAGAAGSSLDELQSGINAFVMKAGQAATVGGASARVFDRLGVSVTDAGGNLRSTETIFRETIDAIAGLDTAAEKATTSAELFGARGARLAAVFGEGSAAIDQWAASAAQAGIVMDEDALQASARMDRALAELRLTMRGIVQSTGDEFIPMIIRMAQGLAILVNAIARVVGAFDHFQEGFLGSTRVGQEWQDRDRDIRESMAETRAAVANAGDSMIEYNGVMHNAADVLAVLDRATAGASAAQLSFAEGRTLSTEEQRQYNQMTSAGAMVARSMGLEWLGMVDHAANLRRELSGLGDLDLSSLYDPITAIVGLESASESLIEEGAAMASFLDAIALSSDDMTGALKRSEEAIIALQTLTDEKMAGMASADLEEANQRRLDAIEVERKAFIDAEEEKAAALQTRLGAADSAMIALAGISDLGRAMGVEDTVFMKSLAATEIMINGLVAGQRALAELGPIAGAIAAAGIAASTTAALGQLAAASIPTMHSGGMVGGSDVLINAQQGEAVLNRQAVAGLGARGVEALNNGGGGGGGVVVEMTYKQRVFDRVVVDNLRKGGPLSTALQNSERRGRRGRIGGAL